ncbi:hypothetical protein LCGC14_1961490 [marine sediment metagenome]|uniref:Uncharacterized protein n=1 Tax=marine sediment metagenome TaxID=412755 RepID=A0A0F9HSX0_9ZZZZ
MNNLPEDTHMLSQPLLTEEGFINSACMNELEATINNMPRTYDRLSNDPEWSIPEIVQVKQITGYFAHWAIRQGDNFPYPPNLEHLVGYLDACLRKEFLIIGSGERWYEMGWCKLSLCQINKMLFDILEGTAEFDAWNTKECLGDNWLDLNALLHNVCISIRDEDRAFRTLSEKIDKEYGDSIKGDSDEG